MKHLLLIPILLIGILQAQQHPSPLKGGQPIKKADSLQNDPYKYEYYPNGQIKYRYTPCFQSGTWEGFYQNGSPRFRFEYVNRRRKGLQTWWKENGDTLSQVYIDEKARIYPASDSQQAFIPIKAKARSLEWAKAQKEIGFPKLMLDAGIRGRLTIKVKVNEEGEVIDYRMISSVWCWIDQLYLLRLLDAKWEPAIGYDDRPTKQWVTIKAFFHTVD